MPRSSLADEIARRWGDDAMTAGRLLFFLRTVVTFLLVPLLVPIAALLYDRFTYGWSDKTLDPLAIIVIAVLAYVGTILLGVPVWLILIRLNRTALIHALLAGFLTGMATLFLAIARLGAQPPGFLGRLAQAFRDNPGGSLAFGGAGAVVASIIWLVARPGRREHS
jgi:hypothetical protein